MVVALVETLYWSIVQIEVGENSHKAVSVYFSSRRLLPFSFAERVVYYIYLGIL